MKSLAGTEDRMPWQWNHHNRLYEAAKESFSLYNYGKICTPILEETDLFIKGTGETTDVVEKQMYTIDSENEESITLRPEGTPPVVRAYLQCDLHKKQAFQKFWYEGPMFRKERPQRGRLRQFHQIGAEAIGGNSPLTDAETILLADTIFRKAGLSNFEVYINSIGCRDCRKAYRNALKELLDDQRDDLCEDCQRRIDRNILRVLDCKNPGCHEVVEKLPGVTDFLCDDCNRHYGRVKDALRTENVPFTEDNRLVRGLDYYTKTVYEIKHPGLGARDTICGGGRYDNLVEQMGGPDIPCVGFAIGVEATLIAMEQELGPDNETPEPLSVYVICFDREAREKCFEQVQKLRQNGVTAEMDYENRSAKAQMRMADKAEAQYCFLIGTRELESEEVLVKEMQSGEQWTVEWNMAAKRMAERLGKN